MGYIKTVKLNDNEFLERVNAETGEVTPIRNRPNNLPKGKKVFNKADKFAKVYDIVDKYLLAILTPVEYRTVSILRNRTQPNTNSLSPLNDETSQSKLAETLGIHRNSVSKVTDKLKNLGVYATFEVVNASGETASYWIFNPYISFRGKIISDEIIGLFKDTVIAKIAQ